MRAGPALLSRAESTLAKGGGGTCALPAPSCHAPRNGAYGAAHPSQSGWAVSMCPVPLCVLVYPMYETSKRQRQPPCPSFFFVSREPVVSLAALPCFSPQN